MTLTCRIRDGASEIDQQVAPCPQTVSVDSPAAGACHSRPFRAHGKPLKASVMNDELKKAAVYDEAQRKLVVAWQATRNDAAHAKAEFKNQTPAAIKLMIASIRDFISRHPL
jgi:hypothetical protein